MAAQLDGLTLLVTLDAPTASVLNQTVEQVYDDSKQWHLNANNRKFPFPWTVSGGEDITAIEQAGQYYFFRNDLGWRIQATDENQDVFWDGNLIPTDITLPIFLARAGRTVSHLGLQPLTTVISAGSGLSVAQDASLTVAEEKSKEVWQNQGLEAGNPLTVTPSKRSTQDAAIDLDLTGDGISTTTVDRQ